MRLCLCLSAYPIPIHHSPLPDIDKDGTIHYWHDPIWAAFDTEAGPQAYVKSVVATARSHHHPSRKRSAAPTFSEQASQDRGCSTATAAGGCSIDNYSIFNSSPVVPVVSLENECAARLGVEAHRDTGADVLAEERHHSRKRARNLDDLDGVLAAKLNIRSRFGADLDNVCDAVAHVALALAVGAHFGGMVLIPSLLATGSIILRVVSRLEPDRATGGGSPTNELMRHLLFAVLLVPTLDFDPEFALIPVFLLHSVSMLVPYRMPALIRAQAKSATAVGLVNVALLAAWLTPVVALPVVAAFTATYLYSFIVGATQWIRRQRNEASS